MFDSKKIAEAMLSEDNAPSSRELTRIMGISLEDFLADEERRSIETADTIPAPKKA